MKVVCFPLLAAAMLLQTAYSLDCFICSRATDPANCTTSATCKADETFCRTTASTVRPTYLERENKKILRVMKAAEKNKEVHDEILFLLKDVPPHDLLRKILNSIKVPYKVRDMEKMTKEKVMITKKCATACKPSTVSLRSVSCCTTQLCNRAEESGT
ncbi:ly6/PLAUR domain-containing protein 2-like [Ambystoma mexicanum]|uniref:ly6/PLAUR domain-containing protein 2-like n=1 Tax=Ambystoma mexicanum TaxID=8296 RepID=UPI0037E70F19